MATPKFNRLFSVLSILILLSCSSDDEIKLANDDYLVFGHFYGECLGEQCIEIYRLEQTRLLEDLNDNYPNGTDFYQGQFIPLEDELFREANTLLEYFPTELLNESSHVIGQPDAGDWGGLYIEYKSGVNHDFWLLDLMVDNVPEYLHEFIEQARTTTSRISTAGED